MLLDVASARYIRGKSGRKDYLIASLRMFESSRKWGCYS